jgi:hypothetical protein
VQHLSQISTKIPSKQTKQKQIKSKTKKNTINEKRGKKTTKQLKSMQIQINKQKCILKLFLFDLFDIDHFGNCFYLT